MTRRRWWTVTFLTVLAAGVGQEVWAVADYDPDTVPLTQLIVTYVPAPITGTVVGVLAAWVPWHFAQAYRRRAARRGEAAVPDARRAPGKDRDMADTTDYPPPKHLDARNRAARTFAQGLAVTALAAAVPVLMTATGHLRWNGQWWLALAQAVGQAVLMAALAYAARYLTPPRP